MRLFKWTRNFDFQSESAIAPVWVRLENLPLHLYDKCALFTIGELLGQPLKIDEATQLRSQAIKIQQDIETISVHVFEKMPQYCVYYRHIGHAEEDCYIKGPKPR
ncbi:hypothetical protein CDL12_13930 [Handroanthus impetiginosus]|uniref:Uncharacterized protein n=1 Tax=Handroanthus impetiginosus TaxID=429701 RepID=A0A2G9H7G5_9LAMI|nr:hypothetical protein CDL12_13930 [Handroanthus impetiginosus]